MSRIEIPDRFNSTGSLSELIEEQERILIPVALGAVLFWWFRGIPSWLEILALGTVYGAIPSYLVGMYLVNRYFEDQRREVIELDLRDEEAGGGITARSWLVPPEVWSERSSGSRKPIRPDQGADAVVTDFEQLPDVGSVSVEGCNSEIADPVSIVARDAKLEEIEKNLIDKAEQLDKLEATLRMKALEIQRENVHSLLAAVEQGTQLDPGAVEGAIDGIDLDINRDADRMSEHDQDQDQSPSYNWEQHRNGSRSGSGSGSDPLEVDP